jgi:hypothetical protein
VLWYYRTAVEQLAAGDPGLEPLAEPCRRALAAIESRATGA